MRRRLRPFLRLFAIATVLLLVSYVGVWCFFAYESRRASRLFEAASSVNIGDTEESLAPILNRYGGQRWNEQLGNHEDYNYVLVVNPTQRLTPFERHSSVRRVVDAINPRFRRAIGLRIWTVSSEVAIKNHRVVAVQGATTVEGRIMWLGAMWRLAEKPREYERNPDAMILDETPPRIISSGNLSMSTGTGEAWDVWITPSSPKEQRQMATRVDFGCLRSLTSCDTVCDLMPEAAQYLKGNPDVGQYVGGGWDESSRTCVKPKPQESFYFR